MNLRKEMPPDQFDRMIEKLWAHVTSFKFLGEPPGVVARCEDLVLAMEQAYRRNDWTSFSMANRDLGNVIAHRQRVAKRGLT